MLFFLNQLICAFSIYSVYGYVEEYEYIPHESSLEDAAPESLEDEDRPKEDETKKALGIKNNEFLPWMGLLVYDYSIEIDIVSSTAVFLIAPSYALCNAEYIISLDDDYLANNLTSVIFPTSPKISTEMRIPVKKYYIHSEYPIRTKNSVGLLKLSRIVLNRLNILHPISWPENNNYDTDIYVVKLVKDEHKHDSIKQEISNMQLSDAEYCNDFYNIMSEKGLENIQPTHYFCLEENSEVRCFYYDGMAAFTYIEGRFILLGLSTKGPGCAYPSRFIEFLPYTTWIKNILPKIQFSYGRRHSGSGRRQGVTGQGEIEGIWTKYILHNMTYNHLSLKLHNYKMKMLPDNQTCQGLNKMIYVYSEAGTAYGHHDWLAYGIYAISIHDSEYEIKCVTVKLDAPYMSEPLYFNKDGFLEVSIDLKVQRIIPPDLHDKTLAKVMFLKDLNLYKLRKVTTIVFRFAFDKKLEVTTHFFGVRKKVTTTTTTTEMPGTTETTTDRHRTHATVNYPVG